MRLSILRVLNLGLCLAAASAAWAQPANNNCANATRITSYNTVGTNVGATVDGDTSCAFNEQTDVWYVLTVQDDGVHYLNTCESSFDTVLSVHRGCPGTTANMIACADDSPDNCGSNPFGSYLSFVENAGETVWIRVAGFGGATGTFTLSYTPSGFGSGNACENSHVAPRPGYSTIGSMLNATNDGSADCGSSSAARDVWYRYTAECTGTLTVTTCGTHDWYGFTDSGMDTVLSLHSGCPNDPGATQLACNDDANVCGEIGAIRDSRVSLSMFAGQIAYIRVAPFGGNFYNGIFRLNIDFSSLCNDNCVNATRMYQNQSFYVASTATATTDGVTNCGSGTARDVWWKFTAPSTNQATFRTCFSNFDTVLSVFQGGCGGPLVACNDDAACFGAAGLQSSVTFTAVQGVTYYLRVAGYNGASGSVTLASDYFPTPTGTYFDPTIITPGEDVVGSLFNAYTSSASVSCHGQPRYNQAGWYRFNPPCNGNLTVTTCGSYNIPGGPGMDTVVSLHTLPYDWQDTEFACNDDTPGCSSGLDSRVTTPVAFGVPVYIRVTNFSLPTGGGYGNGMFRIQANYVPLPLTCDSIDFNNDTSVFDPQDIEAFLSVYSEGPCIPSNATCNDIDFNNDCSLFDPCDIASFLVMYSEGPCTSCGQ